MRILQAWVAGSTLEQGCCPKGAPIQFWQEWVFGGSENTSSILPVHQ